MKLTIKALFLLIALLITSNLCFSADSKGLIQAYYDALNKKDMKQFFALMDPNVIHDINQGPTEIGIPKFRHFMEKVNNSFNEKLSDIVIMISDDGKYGAAQWVDHGIYFKDYPGLGVAAKNQKYVIRGGHFFEISRGAIKRVTTYYNAEDFMKQIRD